MMRNDEWQKSKYTGQCDQTSEHHVKLNGQSTQYQLHTNFVQQGLTDVYMSCLLNNVILM